MFDLKNSVVMKTDCFGIDAEFFITEFLVLINNTENLWLNDRQYALYKEKESERLFRMFLNFLLQELKMLSSPF